MNSNEQIASTAQDIFGVGSIVPVGPVPADYQSHEKHFYTAQAFKDQMNATPDPRHDVIKPSRANRITSLEEEIRYFEARIKELKAELKACIKHVKDNYLKSKDSDE
jgi:hypothetical protein